MRTLKSTLLNICCVIICLLVSQAHGQYCSASSDNCDYEYISDVYVGTIENGGTGCSGYGDYTSMSTIMEVGGSYLITVTNGEPYSGDQCGIWVDWNADEDFFDPNEAITVTGSPGYGPYTAMITPPPGAATGDTRMRVRVMWTGILSSCGTTTYGEVEDYTINVAPPTTTWLEPIADAYVSLDYPNTNYGTETKLRVGEKDSAGYTIYLKFDLSSIPPGQAIFSAQLHLHAYEVSYYAPSVLAKFVTDDSWQETEITGANAPTSYGSTLAVSIAPGDNAWDVTVNVDQSYTTDGVYSVQLGYFLRDYDEYYAHFGSREHPTPSFRPYLEIEHDVPFCGGTGTADNPYQICTGEQMNNIGRLPARWDKHYKLMADISMADYSGSSYNKIGTSSPTSRPYTPFKGVFNGNYHSISDFSYFAYSSSDDLYIGLFGYVHDGTIKNLKLISPNIYTNHYSQRFVGPIAGYIERTDIFGCSVIGGTVDGEDYVGGLIGISKTSSLSRLNHWI